MKHIFISYSREDRDRAHEIRQKLKLFGFAVWMDEESLHPGSRWEDQIEKNIKDACLVIVLLSSHSISQDGYQQREIQVAVEHMKTRPEGQTFVVPVLIDSIPVEKLPVSLRGLHCLEWMTEDDKYKLLQYLHLIGFPVCFSSYYDRYWTQIKMNPLLIVPGYGASGVMLAEAAVNILERMGEPDERMAAYSAGEYFFCYYRKGVEFLIEYDRVASISLYGEDHDRYCVYEGKTPEGITTRSSRKEIEKVYGFPDETGGKQQFEYWCVWVRLGLGITYNTLDHRDLNAKPRNLSIVPFHEMV